MASFADASDVATLLPGRDLTDDELDAADLLCQLATGEIQAATNQQIVLVVNDVANLRGTWASTLRLPQRPVVSVSAINAAGFGVPVGSWQLVQDSLHRGRLPIFNGPDIDDPDLYGTSWFGPGTNVQVTYTHGFAADAIPADLRSAVVRAALEFFVNPEGFTAETIGQYSYQKKAGDGGLVPKATMDALVARYGDNV